MFQQPRQTVFLIVGVCIFYATLRYIVFGSNNWSDFALYIVNKGVALSSVMVAGLAVFSFLKRELDRSKTLLSSLLSLLMVHLLLSLLLFNPEYFPKLFEKERIGMQGGVFILFGVLSFSVLNSLVLYKKIKRFHHAMQLALVLGIVHILFLGPAKWFDPLKWPGYMPNISLLAFLAMATFVVVLSLKKNTS